MNIDLPEQLAVDGLDTHMVMQQLEKNVEFLQTLGLCEPSIDIEYRVIFGDIISISFDDKSQIRILPSRISKREKQDDVSGSLLYLYYSTDIRRFVSGEADYSLSPSFLLRSIFVSPEASGLDAWFLENSTEGIGAQFSNLPINIRYHFCWLLTLLCLEFTLEDSLSLARVLGHVSRETSWPVKKDDFPVPVDLCFAKEGQFKISYISSDTFFPEISKEIGLYPVVDNTKWLKKLLDYGVKTIQLRIKDNRSESLESEIISAIFLGKEYQANVYINDHWELAIKHQAFGVHLGQDDISQQNIDCLTKANIRLGISTHGYFEILRAIRCRPSYIALGHVFATTTKSMPSKPQGLHKLAAYLSFIDSSSIRSFGRLPTVAIGGIHLDNAQDVYQTGVDGVAVVRAVHFNHQQLESIVTKFHVLEKRGKANVFSY